MKQQQQKKLRKKGVFHLNFIYQMKKKHIIEIMEKLAFQINYLYKINFYE